MRKIVRLTEGDISRIVKRIIRENKENTIDIPKSLRSLRDEVGPTASPSEIKQMWNEYVFPEIMDNISKLVSFEDGKFKTKDGESFPVDAILDDLDHVLSGD
jgi:hypothetical protein